VRAAADVLLSAQESGHSRRRRHSVGRGDAGTRAKLAELLQIPVLTTNTGKSGFPEDHPLSLGAMVVSGPQAAFAFLAESDCLFAAGSSLTRTPWGPQVKPGKRVVHLTNDAGDISKEFATEVAMLGDAALGLEALIEAIGDRRRPKSDVVERVAALEGVLARGVRGRLRLRRSADQPLPYLARLAFARRSAKDDPHPRSGQPARTSRAVLAQRRSARLSGLGQIDAARRRPRHDHGREDRAAREALHQPDGRRVDRDGRHGHRNRGAQRSSASSRSSSTTA
jgi:hypothetical protein